MTAFASLSQPLINSFEIKCGRLSEMRRTAALLGHEDAPSDAFGRWLKVPPAIADQMRALDPDVAIGALEDAALALAATKANAGLFLRCQATGF